MDTDSSRALIASPEHYLAYQRRSLDDHLDSISLGVEESKIAAKAGKKIIVDQVLGFFPGGELIKGFLSWNDNVESEIKEAKRNILLADYMARCEENADGVRNLKKLVSSPQGNALFNKLLRILDDSPPDTELTDKLSSALKHIIDTDFASQFEQHKYALSQLERISAPAMTILADHQNWPQMTLGSLNATGSKITSDWMHDFLRIYLASKNISDPGLTSRVRHSIDELSTAKVVEAHLVGNGQAGGTMSAVGGNTQAQLVVGPLGQLILPYITK